MTPPLLRQALRLLILTVILATGPLLHAQVRTGTVKGKVIDPNNDPIINATIKVEGTDIVIQSGEKGLYELELEGGKTYVIHFTHSAHQAAALQLQVSPGRTYNRPIKMLDRAVGTVEITGNNDLTDFNEDPQMQLFPLDPEELGKLPIIAPSVEALMKTMPGVASNNEFSSQYQVRGGNFNENLVYVNDIEVYRPFLARSGEQEGLGFTNAAMAENINFSSGGFAAKYGDRMSSTLDIRYRKPRKFAATIEMGIISTNLQAEGISKNKKDPYQPGRFTWMMGARRFQLSYFLNSLDTQGEYKPLFLDLQGMFTFTPKVRHKEFKVRTRKNGIRDTVYRPTNPIELTAFFVLNKNEYLFEPSSRESTFGTIQQAFRIRTAFEGREISGYSTGMGALMAEFRPTTRLSIKTIFSAFRTVESELIDIEGGYLLGEVNTSFGSDEFGESDFDLGIGSEVRNARNYLTADVISGAIKAWWSLDPKLKHRLRFGAKVRFQRFDDQLKEYTALDSAGYLVNPDGDFGLIETVRADNLETSTLSTGYLQYEWKMGKRALFVGGLRLGYYDLINSFYVSPRVQFVYTTKFDGDDPILRLRLAAGVYQQPPFYRELRRFDGSLNKNMKPQKSTHFIAGLDYKFTSWGREFKLLTEVYYKKLNDLIPYEIQNIRIRYYPDEVADGYAYGVDFRLNGQFIKGVDSWVSLGILKTEEKLRNRDQGFVPRPSDQRVTFSFFFQDELPMNPTFKVHVLFVLGTGMRFGPPNSLEYRTAYSYPIYNRVDLGFSKLITFKTRSERAGKVGFDSLWLTFEVYNLFQRQNTVSYTWIQDLDNNQYAVPNYLSARLLNIRAILNIR